MPYYFVLHFATNTLLFAFLLGGYSHAQDLRKDTIPLNYSHSPSFSSLIGIIDHCILTENEGNIWIKPIPKGYCSSTIKYYNFNLKDKTIHEPELTGMPKRFGKNYYPKNALFLPNQNRIIWAAPGSKYIVITDTVNQYVASRLYPKNKRHTHFTSQGYLFKLGNSLYYPFISVRLPPNLDKNNKYTFGSVPISELLAKGTKRLKYRSYVEAFPCQFPNTVFFWSDRQYFPDQKNQKLWYMDNYRSQVAAYTPAQNSYDCYTLPKQVLLNNPAWHYFDKIDSLYRGVKNYREHDKWIVNSENSKVGYTEQEYFRICSDNQSVLFRSTLIITTDSLLLNQLDSLAFSKAFDISTRPIVNGMPIYHLYEWITLEPEIQHLHQIIVPRGQEIQAVEATSLQLTGFKMIRNDQYQYIPALLNWNLN